MFYTAILSIIFSKVSDMIALSVSHYFDEEKIIIQISSKRGRIYCNIPKLPYGGKQNQPLCKIDISKLPKLKVSRDHQTGIRYLFLDNIVTFAAKGQTYVSVALSKINYQSKIQKFKC